MPPPAVHDDDKKGFAASKNMSYKRYQKAVDDTVSYAVKWRPCVLLQKRGVGVGGGVLVEGLSVRPSIYPPIHPSPTTRLTVALSGGEAEVKQ